MSLSLDQPIDHSPVLNANELRKRDQKNFSFHCGQESNFFLIKPIFSDLSFAVEAGSLETTFPFSVVVILSGDASKIQVLLI